MEKLYERELIGCFLSEDMGTVNWNSLANVVESDLGCTCTMRVGFDHMIITS